MKVKHKLWTEESIVPKIDKIGREKFGKEFWDQECKKKNAEQNELEPQFRID